VRTTTIIRVENFVGIGSAEILGDLGGLIEAFAIFADGFLL
jgi:hypothetical protein